MRAPTAGHWFAERIYRLVLFAFPQAFRAEYGGEMARTFRDWYLRRAGSGDPGELRFWGRAFLDLGRSVPREWLAELRDRARSKRLPEGPHAPPYGLAALAGLAVFALYTATLAPTTAFWDAGEYITVAHILGIPHPPGTPLFVVLGRAWEIVLAPTGLPPAARINLLSAALSAASHALWFLVVDRALAGWTEDRWVRRIGAAAAVLVSATAFTVWSQSNVSEKVYAISLFTTALVSWLLLRWRDGGRAPKLLLLILFLLALTTTNHLMGALVVPAAVLFVFLVDRRALLRPRLWLVALPLIGVALSVQFFLPLRAAQRPLISEGEPACESAVGAALSIYSAGRVGCDALSTVLKREQYGKPSILLDPTVYPQQRVPRSPSLVSAQLANYAQYFDWQWARRIAGPDPLFGGARPIVTLAFLLLGLLGAWTHWRADRNGTLYLGALFVTLSVGLVVYLNFKYGYSIGRDQFPDATMREVRERDYFFLLGFSVWGLWAGTGIATLWGRAAGALSGLIRYPRLTAGPVLGLALLPLALNWSWASRADDYTARDWAYNVLMSVEPYGVLFTNGDNDTFPLWYAQEVEGIRRDVTVIVLEYLNTAWYAKQLKQVTTPCLPGVRAADDPTRILCQRPFEPTELPFALAEAGWTTTASPPIDSILPLPDEQIEQIASTYFIAREPMTLRAGRIQTTIEPGTPMPPADTLAAAILQAALDDRPIHFMPGATTVSRLGLQGHTIRQGLVWKIHNGELTAAEAAGAIVLPGSTPLAPVAGAAIDLALTDTLVWDVYLRRGRILDPNAPWADPATISIPMQYVIAHYIAAEAHSLSGEDDDVVDRHLRRADWWQTVAGG